jgi:ABC-type transport system involved in multi-copper enzyme maturation permease subunit
MVMILITLFCGITSEFIFNKKENIFMITKKVSRVPFFLTKYFASFLVGLAYCLLLLIFFIGIDQYTIHHDHTSVTHFFNVDVK